MNRTPRSSIVSQCTPWLIAAAFLVAIAPPLTWAGSRDDIEKRAAASEQSLEKGGQFEWGVGRQTINRTTYVIPIYFWDFTEHGAPKKLNKAAWDKLSADAQIGFMNKNIGRLKETHEKYKDAKGKIQEMLADCEKSKQEPDSHFAGSIGSKATGEMVDVEKVFGKDSDLNKDLVGKNQKLTICMQSGSTAKATKKMADKPAVGKGAQEAGRKLKVAKTTEEKQQAGDALFTGNKRKRTRQSGPAAAGGRAASVVGVAGKEGPGGKLMGKGSVYDKNNDGKVPGPNDKRAIFKQVDEELGKTEAKLREKSKKKDERGFFAKAFDWIKSHPMAITLITGALGAIVGGIAGGGKGALVGALVGGGLGLGASMLGRSAENSAEKSVREDRDSLASNEKKRQRLKEEGADKIHEGRKFMADFSEADAKVDDLNKEIGPLQAKGLDKTPKEAEREAKLLKERSGWMEKKDKALDEGKIWSDEAKPWAQQKAKEFKDLDRKEKEDEAKLQKDKRFDTYLTKRKEYENKGEYWKVRKLDDEMAKQDRTEADMDAAFASKGYKKVLVGDRYVHVKPDGAQSGRGPAKVDSVSKVVTPEFQAAAIQRVEKAAPVRKRDSAQRVLPEPYDDAGHIQYVDKADQHPVTQSANSKRYVDAAQRVQSNPKLDTLSKDIRAGNLNDCAEQTDYASNCQKDAYYLETAKYLFGAGSCKKVEATADVYWKDCGKAMR